MLLGVFGRTTRNKKLLGVQLSFWPNRGTTNRQGARLGSPAPASRSRASTVPNHQPNGLPAPVVGSMALRDRWEGLDPFGTEGT